METAQKVITAVGGIIAIIGLSWILNGAFDFFSGRKNNDPNRQDQGMSSMISGGALAVLAVSVAAAIVASMGNIKF
ncbi:conserved protein of unknown function (plasmid) [Pseudolactococcus piscium]|mgnify:FL=1|jgi:hypothetical protein|nr:conserved protein of unknown function [Lactococcus piscium]